MQSLCLGGQARQTCNVRQEYAVCDGGSEGRRFETWKLQTSCFISHTHKQNAKYYMHVHCGDGIGTPLFQATPGLNEFRQAWRTVRNVSGGAKSRKQCSLEWCLYEAWRKQELELMANNETINITLDERHGRVLFKYTTSNK